MENAALAACGDWSCLIDSKDVREHLKKTGFEFSDRDKAYLIWQCDGLSVRKRHQAWRALIDGNDDCELSEHLRRVIALEEQMLSWLTGREGTFRSCIGYLASGESITSRGGLRTLDDCLRRFAGTDAIDRLEVSKTLPGGLTVYALLKPDGETMRIDADGIRKDDARLQRGLNAYAFRFPCPFAEGERLKCLCREGVLSGQMVRFLGCRFEPDAGMLAGCEWTDAFGGKDVFGVLLLDLARDA